jgi:ribosomal protein S20
MFGIGSIDKFEESLVKDKRNKLTKGSAKRYVKDFLKASKSKDVNGEISKLNKKYEKYFSANCYFLVDF